MSVLSEIFIHHLAAVLCKEYKDVKEACDSFYTEIKSSPLPVKPVEKKIPTTKPVPKKKVVEKSTCCRIPRSKTEPCGSPARNKVVTDGVTLWYCGTPKSGCYKSILAAQNRKIAAKTSLPKKPVEVVPPKPKTLKDRKVAANKKTVSLINRVTKVNKLVLRQKSFDGKMICYDPKTGIVFHKETREAYGHLNGDKIEDLTDENLRYLETNNISIAKSTAVDGDSDEETPDDSDDDILDLDDDSDDDILDLDDSDDE